MKNSGDPDRANFNANYLISCTLLLLLLLQCCFYSRVSLAA